MNRTFRGNREIVTQMAFDWIRRAMALGAFDFWVKTRNEDSYWQYEIEIEARGFKKDPTKEL